MRRKNGKFLLAVAAVAIMMFSGNVVCANSTAMTGAEISEKTVSRVTASIVSGPGSSLSGDERENADNNAEYLKVYFGVEFSGDRVDSTAFSEALKKVSGEEVPEVEGDMTLLKAVKAAVSAANDEELALSYPESKVEQRLNSHGIYQSVDGEYAAALACALDVSLISDSTGMRAASGNALSTEDAVNLLMQVADANGDARNYLGMASDPDIYGKIDQAWDTFVLFDDEMLTNIGKEAVQQQVTTGYGIKSSAYSARFLPELTLQYGHSDAKHARQLIGLLNSENIDAKVQLEPKISIYQHLLEWGPVGESTPTFAIVKFSDDLYLANAVEYDLLLEFNTTEDMLKFDNIVKTYAKKYEGNEDAEGLIYKSFWQPLYSTTKTDMPEEDYHLVYDCVVTNGIYSIHPFTLPENTEMTIQKLKEFAGDADVDVTPIARYVNTAFYNYLNGTDYQ